MYLFWDLITEPMLEAVKPRSIVEIGSEDGNSTAKLLAFCQKHDAVLHAIDPTPRFDVAAWRQFHGPRLTVHQTLSLQALPTLPAFDMAFIDGDHNWYTVFNELRLIDQRSGELGQPFPLVVLHDVGWPYGRRDLYYDPNTIPAACRQPHARKGLQPGQTDLVEGGINAELCHATAENTPRNGVLTAVEDFLRETKRDLIWHYVPALFGLGFLYPRQLLELRKEVAKSLQMWNLPAPVCKLMQMLEWDRLARYALCKQLEGAMERLTHTPPMSGYSVQIGGYA